MGKDSEFIPNRRLDAQLKKHLAKQLDGVGRMLRDEVVLSLGLKSNLSGTTPSAPGEPPAIQTGVLRSSIFSEVDNYNLALYIGVDAGSPANNYGAALEFGTATIAPRPFIRPAIFNNIHKIKKRMTD